MKKNGLILFCYLLAASSLSAQNRRTIIGLVTDSLSGAPLASCSVFISNSSIGTITDAAGAFHLENIPNGKGQLIVSIIGYETIVYPITANNENLKLQILLRRKVQMLDDVIVAPYEKHGWAKWGQVFTDYLIGTSITSQYCTIRNTDQIHFRYSKQTNELRAFADEPLIIENQATGYIIKYQLEEFTINLKTRTFVYLGFPLFAEIPAQSKQESDERSFFRQQAYYGSVTHFMRCLYSLAIIKSKPIQAEGFEIWRVQNELNTEKTRVAAIFAQTQSNTASPVNKDSIRYYKKVLQQADSVSKTERFSAESLVQIDDQGVRTLYFESTLHVIYRPGWGQDRNLQRSSIRLLTPAAIEIQENGYYDPVLELFCMGDWANSEKLANALPIDYWPPVQR